LEDQPLAGQLTSFDFQMFKIVMRAKANPEKDSAVFIGFELGVKTH
jgi:hypothetical protein